LKIDYCFSLVQKLKIVKLISRKIIRLSNVLRISAGVPAKGTT
jgi:hypothetical protein